jgi:hypothetical protein
MRNRLLLWGFVAGALAVPLFHQPMLALLHAAGISPRGPYAMQPNGLGVPAVVSLTFWGGVWGVVLAAVLGRIASGAFFAASTLFGAIFPTLVAWLVVFPLKGQPIGGGWKPAGIETGLLVNAAWGLGTAIFLRLFSRRRALA